MCERVRVQTAGLCAVYDMAEVTPNFQSALEIKSNQVCVNGKRVFIPANFFDKELLPNEKCKG